MSSKPLVRVFVKGGLISPADLLKIMDVSEKAGNSYIMFGSRQDILFSAAKEVEKAISAMLEETDMEFSFTDSKSLKELFQKENIVSSYVGVNIMDTTWWLKEDVYHYVLESFDYQPVFKVNVIDPIQSLVPLFTGHLNFIASKHEHYWYLFIRKEESNDPPEQWPDLIHGNDMPLLARQIEKELMAFPALKLQDLYEKINEEISIHTKEPDEELRMPTALFPYYEGLNSMQNNLLWLGLYWRNNRFDIDFLSTACRLCQETKVGKISITPWKSFIIKGIRSKDRILWEKIMGRFGINLRHSSLELNWHLPVIDDEALELKRFLVRELDQHDISTHGLTFTIKNTPNMLLFTSIVIEKNLTTPGLKEPFYNILYARDFNPNHSEYFCFAKEVKRVEVPNLLIKLSKFYFQRLEGVNQESHKFTEGKGIFHHISSYQCVNCMTVYDKKYGDPEAGIRPGTPFEELPEEYLCPLCTNKKGNFIPLTQYQ